MPSLDGMAEGRTLTEYTLHHRTNLIKADETWLCGIEPCNITDNIHSHSHSHSQGEIGSELH